MNEITLKGVVNDMVESITALVKIRTSKKDVNKTIDTFYQMGHDEIEVQFGLNLTKNSKELAFLKDYTFDNIKNLNNDIKEQLRKELSQGLINSENISQLTKRVSKVMDVNKVRAQMIVRTETNRTFNVARQCAVEKSGLKLKKEWVSAIDDRTSPVCRYLDKKILPLNQKFKYEGKTFETPPAHINCRSR